MTDHSSNAEDIAVAGIPDLSPADESAPDRTDAHLDGSISPFFMATIGASAAILIVNLYYAQPLIAGIASDLHIKPTFAGAVVSVSQFGYAIGLFFLVPLSDMFENRRLVLACGALALLGTIGLATATSAGGFLFSALVTGIFSSAAQMLIPYLSHVLPARRRGRLLGTVMSGVLAAIMLARPFALFVASHLGWRAIYWISAAATLALGLVLSRVMRERRPSSRTAYAATIASMFVLFAEERRVRRRTIYQAVLFSTFTMFWAVTPIMLVEHFGLNQAQIGMFALVGASGALTAPLAGRWADRGFVKLGTALAGLLLAAAFLSSVWAVHALMLLALVAAAVLIDGAIQASQTFSRLIVLEVAPERRGRINAMFMTIVHTSGALGSIVGVFVYVTFGWPGVGLLGAALALVVAGSVVAEPGS